jgi:hypothetical protein
VPFDVPLHAGQRDRGSAGGAVERREHGVGPLRPPVARPGSEVESALPIGRLLCLFRLASGLLSRALSGLCVGQVTAPEAHSAIVPEGVPVTEPVLSGPELDQAVVTAAREYIAARLARPRDAQRIADAKTDLDALIVLRDSQDAGA